MNFGILYINGNYLPNSSPEMPCLDNNNFILFRIAMKRKNIST